MSLQTQANITRPPNDQTAATQFETATFGLG
jgi:hypothetical protein